MNYRSPAYKTTIETDVFVEMRDGVKLAADLFRPEAKGKFPALLSMSPYGKGQQSLRARPQPPTSPIHTQVRTAEAGDPFYFTSKGYVHVIADCRGSGHSEGEYLGWMSKQEAEDGYDMIEWIAEQPWCNGKVGMVGISYFGTIQLHIAAEQPPHLKAIMPWNGVADFYREATHHGGILETCFLILYNYMGAEVSSSSIQKSMSPEKFKAMIEKAKKDPDLVAYPQLWNTVDCFRKNPYFFDVIMNPTDGPFYWERSAYKSYDKIKVPFYAHSGWWAYGHMHLIGSFNNYLEIKTPKKLDIEPPIDSTHPLTDEFNAEALRWFDYWLKGIDTGIMKEPPIRLWVNGINRYRYEKEWPLARTVWTKYYLRNCQSLSTKAETYVSEPDSFVQEPIFATSAINSLKYFTPSLIEDTEVTGPIAFYLYASIDQNDTNWMVSLTDVAPDGASIELTQGFLKASHRGLDRRKSKPWRPYQSHVNPELVNPGQIYDYALELAPTSNLFKAGHQILLEIYSMDHPGRPKGSRILHGEHHHPWHQCSGKTVVHTIYHNKDYPSYVLLPIIPRKRKKS
ncbi:MAG: CocE/NonD family hydrolase [Nitrososphaerota archaeon]|nr:CocE/NonD family hydrolase [Nitrososphaerota archaeon]